MIVAALAVAVQVASKAARDGAFLGVYDADLLPRAIMIAALLSIVAVAFMSSATRRFGPRRTVPALFLISAFLFALEWMLWSRLPHISAILIFGHVTCLGALLLSGFWSLITDAFDARGARAALGTIGTGATFGGLVGGLAAERVSALFGLEALLLSLAVVQVVASVLSSAIRSNHVGDGDNKESEIGLRELVGNGYTIRLAALVVLIAAGGGLLDFLLKSSAKAAFVDPTDITRFFGLFYTGTALLAFVIQATVGRRALERFGLTTTAIGLPILILLGGASFLAIPSLAAAGFGRGGEMVMRTSLYRSAYELFYAPLAPGRRNRLKAWIDVGVERLGDAVSGGLVQVLLLFAAAPRLIAGAAILLAGTAVFMVIKLGRGYVEEVQTRLKVTTKELANAPGTMATMATLGLGGLDLTRVLRQSKPSRPTEEGELAAASTARTVVAAHISHRSLTKERASALYSDDPAVVSEALESRLTPELVPLAIALLSRNKVALAASRALAKVSHRHVGQLVDTLLDTEEPLSTRRRIPRIIATAPSLRARAGLLEALRDRRFEVRLRSAEAMFQLRQLGGPAGAPISDDALNEFLNLELDRHAHPRVAGPLGVIDMVRGPVADTPRVYQLFLLIALAQSPDAVTSAYRANMTGDETLRGLSLEYLASVVPLPARDRLLAHLDANTITPTTSLVEIENSLITSRTAIDAALSLAETD